MIQILLNCARQEMSPELLAETLPLLETVNDWEALVRTAWRHGVAPLLHRHLEAHVPNECKDRLRQSYVRAAVRSRTHFTAIAELAREFARQGVPLLLLKGAALGLTTYRDPALRPFADIDLLIREGQIDWAKAILAACGYTLAPELISEELSRRFHVNLPFVKAAPQPVHVELHWQLSDQFTSDQLPTAEFWENARRISVADTSALVLKVEDEVAYLATHLDKHGYLNQALGNEPKWIIDELSANRLIWFTDLHEVITRNEIDWLAIDDNVAITTSLRLLHQLLGTSGIPEKFLAQQPARFSKRLALGLAKFSSKRERRRVFFRRHILATRKGFELRLVRLLDLWNYIFPGTAGSLEESAAALGQSLSLFFAFLRVRLRRR
ncbi:MAG: nucleotidyltransferase family protein [Verrucomicrobiota bacterium]|nr:nucleotidyltransferase family protein [Verrucomicrobiota bacterium]